MSALDNYQLQYEEMPFIKPLLKRVGKDSKMSKPKTTNEAPVVYSKTKGEHFKDIVIAVLVAGIIAFIGGMTFQSKQQGAIDTAVKAVTPTAQASEVKK